MSGSSTNSDAVSMTPPEDLAQSLTRFCQAINDTSEDDPGLHAYQANFVAAHASALASNFPIARTYVTAERFDALAEVFVCHHVPETWDINLYDSRFPDFVAAQVNGPLGAKVPWAAVAHLMAFEYAICQVYYADDLWDVGGFATKRLSKKNTESDARVRYLPPLNMMDLWPEFGGKLGHLLDLLNDLLMHHYPFIDCLERITFEQPIRVARAGVRIEVQIVQTNEGVP